MTDLYLGWLASTGGGMEDASPLGTPLSTDAGDVACEPAGELETPFGVAGFEGG